LIFGKNAAGAKFADRACRPSWQHIEQETCKRINVSFVDGGILATRLKGVFQNMLLHMNETVRIECDCGRTTRPLLSGDTIYCPCGTVYKNIKVNHVTVEFLTIHQRSAYEHSIEQPDESCDPVLSG